MRDGAQLRCPAPCDNVLAVWHADVMVWEIRHRGRRILARELLLLTCEDCGTALPVPAMPGAPVAVLVPGGQPVPWVDRP